MEGAREACIEIGRLDAEEFKKIELTLISKISMNREGAMIVARWIVEILDILKQILLGLMDMGPPIERYEFEEGVFDNGTGR